MVLQVAFLHQSVSVLNHSNSRFLVARINMSINRRIRFNQRLLESGVKFCAMHYSKIICNKCFKPVGIGQRLFRKNRPVRNYKGSRYMHIECAERYNYV